MRVHNEEDSQEIAGYLNHVTSGNLLFGATKVLLTSCKKIEAEINDQAFSHTHSWIIIQNLTQNIPDPMTSPSRPPLAVEGHEYLDDYGFIKEQVPKSLIKFDPHLIVHIQEIEVPLLVGHKDCTIFLHSQTKCCGYIEPDRSGYVAHQNHFSCDGSEECDGIEDVLFDVAAAANIVNQQNIGVEVQLLSSASNSGSFGEFVLSKSLAIHSSRCVLISIPSTTDRAYFNGLVTGISRCIEQFLIQLKDKGLLN